MGAEVTGSRRPAALDPTALKALARPSNGKGLGQLATHLSLLALTSGSVLWLDGSLWIAPALMAQGVVLAFLFAPLHETIHYTAFRSRWLNAAVARVAGVVLLLPADYFRAYHLRHHRFTQDPARDPELKGRPLSSRRAYLLRVSGLPYWHERLAVLCRHAFGRVTEDFIAPRRRAAIIREARGHIVVYGFAAAASFAAGSDLLLLLWVIPALLGQPALRLFLLAEHSGCPQVPDMLENSRTTLTHPVIAALCWNMNRHTAHHAYPAVPFYALPRADSLLATRIALRAQGYVAVHREIWESLARA